MSDFLGPTALGDLQQGRHACLVYEDKEQVLALIAPFVAAGLLQHERCVYVVGEHDLAKVRSTLTAHGVNVAEEEQRGALVFVSQWEVSFPNGEFDPAAMIAYVRAGIADAVNAGFRGLRVIAEMTWALQMGVGHNKLIHYEALGNHLYPDEPLVAICMYDRSRFPASVCNDALRVHPVVSTGGDAGENPFYELPHAVTNGSEAHERLDWMVEQLDRMRDMEKQRTTLLQLQAAQAAKDDLLSVLAHELRTPITATLTSVRLAMQQVDRPGETDAPKMRRALERIERQAVKQSRMIDHVLSAARLATGELPLDRVEFDLVTLVSETVEMMRAVATDREIRLETIESARIVADPIRVEQVVNNLLDNALKFSPPGAPMEVSLRFSSSEVLELCVRDHGIGIPAEEQTRVFERYHRAHQGYRGLGLGLHICAEIVRRHGGEIFAESAAGGGTRMVARLPAMESAELGGGPQQVSV